MPCWDFFHVSSEEAKKKIYACSTTTYTGFQVECSEETSEKFKGENFETLPPALVQNLFPVWIVFSGAYFIWLVTRSSRGYFCAARFLHRSGEQRVWR